MTARTLTAPQRRALLWLAETPGEWRIADQERQADCIALMLHDDLMAWQCWAPFCFGLTPAGIQAAKELAA